DEATLAQSDRALGRISGGVVPGRGGHDAVLSLPASRAGFGCAKAGLDRGGTLRPKHGSAPSPHHDSPVPDGTGQRGGCFRPGFRYAANRTQRPREYPEYDHSSHWLAPEKPQDASAGRRGLLRGDHGGQPPGGAALHVLVVHAERSGRSHLRSEWNLAGQYGGEAFWTVAAWALVGRHTVGDSLPTAGIRAARPREETVHEI